MRTKPAEAQAPVEQTTQKNDLSLILQRLEKLEAENTLLKKVADKAKIERFTPKEELTQEVLISLYRERLDDEYKVVVGWEMIKNYVRTTRERSIEEDQVVEITLADGEKVQMQYIDFATTAIDKVSVPVIATERRNGEVTLTVLYNNTEYKMSPTFIN